jgi:hypothetical protein
MISLSEIVFEHMKDKVRIGSMNENKQNISNETNLDLDHCRCPALSHNA